MSGFMTDDARHLLGLRASAATFEATDARGKDARRCMSQYFAELDERFDGGFDPGDAQETDPPAFTPPNGLLLLVLNDGQAIGCGALQRIDDGTAEIKRMWIDSRWRGVGLGRRLLDTLESHARRRGYRRCVLDTNATLIEAIAMYESAGYLRTRRYNENPYAQRWFTKVL